MLWPVEKRAVRYGITRRVRYGTIRERMADGSEGARMRRIKGARHAHAAIRAQGRIPGEEGRAVAALYRQQQAQRQKVTAIN
jgi:hypothetical protein